MKNKTFKINFSFTMFENGSTWHSEYLVKAPDQTTAINKATIKFLREYNPIKFIWNSCYEYDRTYKNHDPLCESFAGGY